MKTSTRAAKRTKPIAAERAPTRLDQLTTLLQMPDGATIAELAAATGWQQHSVRGAIAGALSKRGLVIVSDKVVGVRRYHASTPA